MKKVLIFFVFCSPMGLLAQTNQLARWLQIGNEFLNTHADSSLYYADRALQAKQTQRDCKTKGDALYLKGAALYRLNALDESEYTLNEAVALRKKCNNDSSVAAALSILLLVMVDDTARAARFSESIRLAQKSRDTMLMGKIYTNYAKVWADEGQHEKALGYNRRCEELLKNTTRFVQRGNNRIGLGNRLLDLYYDNDDSTRTRLDEAASYFSMAITDFKASNKPEALKWMADAKNGLGVAKMYSDDLKGAAQNFRESIQLCYAQKDTPLALHALYNLSIVAESETHFLAAADTLVAAGELIKNYHGPGIGEFMRNQLTGSELANKQTILRNQDRIQKVEQSNRLIIGVCVFVVFLSIIGFLLYRQRMRNQKLLADQEVKKQQLHVQQLENKIQEREILFVREKLEVEEAERLRIARMLHDGVGGMLISAKWNLESALEEAPPDSSVARRLADNIRQQEASYQELRKVAHQLRDSISTWWQELQAFCERLSNGHPSIQFHTRNLDERVGNKLGEQARLMTQELIVNALKYSNASEINIEISQSNQLLSIMVQDNGMGFDPQSVSTGMGLREIRERVEHERGGAFTLESAPAQGTTVFIDLPLTEGTALDTNLLKFDNDEPA